MAVYLLAHDLGTSGNKASLFDENGALVKSMTCSYPLDVKNGNWAEQNADDWWKAVCDSTRALLDGVNPADIAGVSFSGQMMGALCVDRDGNPLRPSIIWADMRAADLVDGLRKNIGEMEYYKLTGHRLSASYSGAKLAWVRENEPDVYRKTDKVLNAKDYILYKLTGNMVTEPSDGSSTCLLDISTLQWSETLADLYGISMDKLPELRRSVDLAGKVTKEAASLTGLLEGTPVICGGGDGPCAAVGSGAVKEGIANCCLGTSSWISFASREPLIDENMTTFTFAHMVPGYVLPTGTMQQGGGALSWAVKTLFRDFPMDKSAIYDLVNREVSASPVGAKGLVFHPYLIGERSPRWNDKAKGSFIGLTLEHDRGDMLRAVMEGVALNFTVILDAFRENGAQIGAVNLLGGGARNPAWRKILADAMGVTIRTPTVLEEATSMGAAVTAGVGTGVFRDFSVIDKFLTIREEIQPDVTLRADYDECRRRFDETYKVLEPLFNKY